VRCTCLALAWGAVNKVNSGLSNRVLSPFRRFTLALLVYNGAHDRAEPDSREVEVRMTTRPYSITEQNTFTTTRKAGLKDTLIAVALFFSAILFLLPLRHQLRFSPDEGLLINGAERLLAGQVPYRDFFALVTPGSYYLLAGEFRLFGHFLLAPNTALILYGGLFAAMNYCLARRLYGRLASLLSSYLVVLSIPPGFNVVHNWDSTVLALLAVYSAHLLLDSHARVWALTLGLAISTTILFEQSKGAGLVLGNAMAAIALMFCRRTAVRFSTRNVAWFLTGAVIPLAVTAAYFAQRGALSVLIESVLWPLRHYSAVNQVPYGWVRGVQDILTETLAAATWTKRLILLFVLSPYMLIPVLAAVVVGMTPLWVWLRCKAHGDPSVLDHQILGGCIFVGIWFSVLGTRRADVDHLIFVLPIFGYLIPGTLDFQKFDTERIRQVRGVIAGYMVVAFTLFGLSTLERGTWTNTKLGPVITRPEVAELLGTLQPKIGGSKHLYVHPYQPFLYAVTGTQNPTKFDILFPGMNTLENFREAVEELRADNTHLVLLDVSWPSNAPLFWPSTPASALASDPVSDYIVHNYRLCAVLAREDAYRYYLMAPRNSSCTQ
jgi:hypothetical protein